MDKMCYHSQTHSIHHTSIVSNLNVTNFYSIRHSTFGNTVYRLENYKVYVQCSYFACKFIVCSDQRMSQLCISEVTTSDSRMSVCTESMRMAYICKTKHIESHSLRFNRILTNCYYHVESETTEINSKVNTIENKRYFAKMCEFVAIEEIEDLPNHPEKLLIDVRDPPEIECTGLIPMSINIPLGTLEETLKLSDEEFKTQFNRDKPTKETEIIFTCKTGRRAAIAAELVISLDFENTRVYKGSWTEWAAHKDLN